MSMEKTCKWCGDVITGMRSDTITCKKKECKQKQAGWTYSLRLKEKCCKYCEKSFKGKDKQIVCVDCKEKINPQWKTVQQSVICRVCSVVLATKEKKITKTSNVVRGNLCLDCLEKSRQKSSEMKKGVLNPMWKGGIKKVRMTREKLRLFLSERMKLNNPMKNKETAIKVSNKLRGVSRPKGPYAKHWRGNRPNSFVLRSRLKQWVQDVLSRDGYKCTLCGSHSCLEVHHKVPFRDIVVNSLRTLGLGRLTDVDNSSKSFEDLSTLVLQAHTLDVGLTLCRTCHALVDKKRHYENKKHQEDTALRIGLQPGS